MEEQNKDIVLSILKRIFGNPKSDYTNQVQYEFNCPSKICKNDRNKFNLNFNYNKVAFHCFKCGYHGAIHSVVFDYGKEEDVKRINLLYPKSEHKIFKKSVLENIESTSTCELPADYRPLTDIYDSKYYRMAIKYLEKRKVSKETIKKYEDYVKQSVAYDFSKPDEMLYFVGKRVIKWFRDEKSTVNRITRSLRIRDFPFTVIPCCNTSIVSRRVRVFPSIALEL